MICLGSVVAQANSLTLNGSAHYYQLTRDYYLGGLYLPKTSDDINYIHAASTSKRMQIIINIPTWTPRRWAQVWQNNIAINNDNLGTNEQIQQALQNFTGFLKDDLKAGDVITIDYQAYGNSRVLLNNELAFETAGTDFFNYLINTWIGPLPPTREFRQAILGLSEQDANDSTILFTHKPPRGLVISGWLAQEEAIRQATAEAEAARLAEQKRIEQAAAAAAEKRRLEEAERRAEAIKLAEEQALIAKTQEAESTATSDANAANTADIDDSNRLQTIADEQRYYLDMLQWEVQRKVETSISYPAWAKQFGQEGEVVIDFRLSAQKEVSEINVRNEQLSDLLINEVVRATKVAVESINIPTDLTGKSWLLYARYNFNLQGTKQVTIDMPEAPESIKQSAAPMDSSQALEQYGHTQKARILEAVIYPAGAKMLKKQDTVRATLILDKTGKVIGLNSTAASRHRELNQALIDAVKKNEPFPPFPLGVEAEQLDIELEYDFKL